MADKRIVDDDVDRIITLALDIAFYRRHEERPMGHAAWLELRDAVDALPESTPGEPRSRSVTEIGPGDYVKVVDGWQKVTSNSAYGREQLPRHWTIRTENGLVVGGMDVHRYAKASDPRD